jgi:opacity protein-like surface antigen
MKKLTLTFCALSALVLVAPALYADGPEPSSKEKEVMQPAPPVCDFYRAHEWDLSIWGAYAFAADTGQNAFDTSRNPGGDLKNDPFALTGTDEDPFLFEVSDRTNPCFGIFCEPKFYNPNERLNVGQISKNQLFARDDTFGGGFDVKYFWSKYFGAGIEGVGLAAKTNFAGGGLATLTGRFPFGRFAPYLTGGIGFIDGGATLYEFYNEKNVSNSIGNVRNEHEFFTVDPVYNNHLRALGQIGVGMEYRVTCHIGLMADFTWNFVFGQENHPDKIRLVTEQGQSVTTSFGTVISSFPVVNRAFELVPGHGSDNQDFGLVRFGVTFSY